MLYWLQKKFGFSKKELNGITVLILIMTSIWVIPFLYGAFHTPEPLYFERLAMAEKKLVPAVEAKPEQTVTYFTFDPNNLTASEWEKLGLQPHQIRNIRNFEEKGGRFYKKEDFSKLYTISADDYRRLAPFIQIVGTRGKVAKVDNEQEIAAPVNRNEHTQPVSGPPTTLEINATDSAALIELPGIGPVFASRIVRYRSLLGGFYKKEQLLEVYGMDADRYRQIAPFLTVDPAGISRIDINKADFNELRKHPYLTTKYARLIEQYRKQHGSFKHTDDLLGIAVIDVDYLRKIAPYLLINDD